MYQLFNKSFRDVSPIFSVEQYHAQLLYLSSLLGFYLLGFLLNKASSSSLKCIVNSEEMEL